MKNQEHYLELYTQKREENFKQWGYYYPPADWNEFELWNNTIYQKYLHKSEWESEAIKTRAYVALLDNDSEFGFFIAFKNHDFEILNNVLFQTSRQKILDRGMTASEANYDDMLIDALAAFACNDFGIIDSLFPKNRPLSEFQHYTDVSVNLLKVLYYKKLDLLEDSVQKAQKFITKNVTRWEKLVVSYFLSLVNHDLDQVNICLQKLCVTYQNNEPSVNRIANKLDKCFAKEIHGLYRFAKIVDDEFFQKITLPKHDSFLGEFEIWQKEHHYPKGKLFYTYSQEMNYMNKIFEAKIPTISLIKMKVDRRMGTYRDEEQFALDLAKNIKKN